jgi:small-conductance mechanosensitive channel
MTKSMIGYFTAEKQESLLFIAVGLIAVAVGLWLWMNGHRLRSMAFPLIAVAAIQIVVGSSVYLRTDAQVATLSAQLETTADAARAAEDVRMAKVMKNFGLYKIIEIVLLTIGVLLVLFLRQSDLAVGIGAGLILQSSFMLALDMFAELRAEEYIAALG